MKIRTMLGLTALGTAIYAHRRRGGEFTVESVKQSFKDLWTGIQGKAGEAKDAAVELADKAQDKVKGLGGQATPARGTVSDGSGSGSYPGNPSTRR